MKRERVREQLEKLDRTLARIDELEAKHFVFISDHTRGGDAVQEALGVERALLPAVSATIRVHHTYLTNTLEWSTDEIPVFNLLWDEVDSLCTAILTTPRVQSADRLRAAMERITASD